MQDNISVTILCAVYNHKKYLRECLEGLVNQKTNFRYEIIINDDASTDGSEIIIKEYENKYPDIVKPIYQKENQYSKGSCIFEDFLFPKVSGKYFAMCEGDDYWTDPEKLQKQYDMMEKHPECSICTHKVEYVNEKGIFLNKFAPLDGSCLPHIVSSEFFFNKYAQYRKQRLYFHTSSYFMRSEYIEEYLKKWSACNYIKNINDVPYLFYYALKGGILYISDTMSAYRNSSIGSWSERVMDNTSKVVNHHMNAIKYLQNFDDLSGCQYHGNIRFMVEEHEYIIASKEKSYDHLCNPKYLKFIIHEGGIKLLLSIYYHAMKR